MNTQFKFTTFSKCNILTNDQDKDEHVFVSTNLQSNVVNFACRNGYQIVVKNGINGTWIAKGKDKKIEYLKDEIEKNTDKYEDDVFCILIEKIEMDNLVKTETGEVLTQQETGTTLLCCEVTECPICFDEIETNKNNITTECGHKFHTSCLMKNVTINGFGCPYCRSVMAEEPTFDEDSEENSEEDDDSEFNSLYDESVEGDYVLRGVRWLFQREEGELLEDDEPTPSITNLTQRLIESGFTMENLIEIIMNDSPLYRENLEQSDILTQQFHDTLNNIIENFTPEQALEQAEQERLMRRREESVAIEEEYFRTIKEEEDQLRRNKEMCEYYSMLDNLEEEQEFQRTMKKFSTKPRRPLKQPINELLLEIGEMFLE